MRTFRKFAAFAALALVPLFAFAGCSDGGEDAGEPTVAAYVYYMDYYGDGSYHNVIKYHVTDNGDSTYEVKGASWHLFAMSRYGNFSGSSLCDIVMDGTVRPNSSKGYETVADFTEPVTDYPGRGQNATFRLKNRMPYTVYFYF